MPTTAPNDHDAASVGTGIPARTMPALSKKPCNDGRDARRTSTTRLPLSPGRRFWQPRYFDFNVVSERKYRVAYVSRTRKTWGSDHCPLPHTRSHPEAPAFSPAGRGIWRVSQGTADARTDGQFAKKG
jgi:hypothetical protein